MSNIHWYFFKLYKLVFLGIIGLQENFKKVKNFFKKNGLNFYTFLFHQIRQTAHYYTNE